MIKNAVERATEMMVIPFKDLPKLAVEHAKYMCDKFCLCGETFITAYANYAQVVEGLKTDDPLYKLDKNNKHHKKIIDWFNERANV